MNYIYDILLNLNKKLFDFYEWNTSDEILHVRKIPIIRVSKEDLFNLRNKQVMVDASLLKKICNRCEVFTNRDVKIINYVCIFSDTKDVLAIEFNQNGIKNKMSKLLIDEEEEVIEVAENIECSEIKYEVNKVDKIDCFKTRRELKMYDYILKQFNKNNYNKLKYLYFEYFDKEEDNYSTIIINLKKEIDNNWGEACEKIYNFLRLSSQKQ